MEQSAGTHQFICHEKSAHCLGEQCGDGDSHDAHMEDKDKNHVQNDVDDTADDQDVQRISGVPGGAQDSGAHIVDEHEQDTPKINPQIDQGIRHDLCRRIHETEHERSGQYQLYAREIILDGAGALYEKFEALKKELAEMGMFAREYKQPVPKYIHTLGVVTAPTGAAVRDIINIAGRRNPYVQIILYPAQVQGEGAAESIVRGIRALEKKKVDVMIVGRGGGSIEDLWAFNEEAVARAIFECSIPVISAVGHETDTTIADFVADLRAPTPSAAAELAVYDHREARERIRTYQEAMLRQVTLKISEKRSVLERLRMRLDHAHPRQKLNESRQYAADLETRLRLLMQNRLDREKHRLALCVEKMKGLSPLEKLSHGYSYIQNQNGENIRSIRQVSDGTALEIYVSDGRIRALVTGSGEEIK